MKLNSKFHFNNNFFFLLILFLLNKMDPMWLAMSKFRRGKIEECIVLCDELLSKNPADQAAWFLKCKSVIKQNYIDDIELDEEGVAEMLLDENAIASMPR